MNKNKAEFVKLSTAPEGDGVRATNGLDVTERGTGVFTLERWMLQRMLKVLGNPTVRLVLWNGEEVQPSEGAPATHMLIRDRAALWQLVGYPELGFGELYRAGRIEVEGSLVEFLETVYRAMAVSSDAGYFERRLAQWRNRPRANTLEGSRDNIHRHYDIGNEFYQLWLDQEMVYTCAYFPSPSMTLEQAQLAKMDHVCRKLGLRPGQTVVEAGCGWGSLARHMARFYGVKVRAFNISRQQIEYARDRARSEGLDDRIEYVEDDYRNISGRYDAFVSVGMLEHVGVEHYRGLGDVIDRALKESGRGLIHTIGRNRPGLMSPWIEKRIFPGAQPPSLSEVMDIFEPNDFSVLDVENLRLHYAKTLEHWLWRFDKVADRVRDMFDESFVRTWRLYLAGSIAAFTSSDLQLFQVAFARARNNTIPWTRAGLYQPDATPDR